MVHKKKKAFLSKAKPAPLVQPTKVGNVEEEEEEEGRVKKGRLIVRNLPFKGMNELKLKDFFDKYGNIVEVQLLRLPDGKLKGCGFVEFDKRQSAAKAIFHTNGKQMSGRPIVVDWALPKHTFIEKLKQLSGGKQKKVPKGEVSEELVEYTIDTEPDRLPGDEGESDDDDKPGDEDDNGNYSDDTLDDEDGIRDEEDSDDNYDDKDDESINGDLDEKPHFKKALTSDVDEGKTVFIKNVPFAAKDEDVKRCVEAYGPVVYALVCVDKLTEHSKGTAFAKFKDKESADKCLKDSKNITLMEQVLEVTRAVSKNQLDEEKKKKKTKVKDSRNLFLVREGVIMAGSPAAATVSASDMAKRLQIEQWKSQILRNLNMFVSRTRLVVHNVPVDYDDAKLRRLFEQYSGPKAVVKEARVMRDRKKLDGQGQGLSKELGFVTFINHEDALHALRQINNNPNIFTPNRRPIISFSIENREILNLKQKRLEKSRVKVMGSAKNVESKGSNKLNKKQRRYLRRKEKLIAKRREAKKLKKESGEGTTGKKKGVNSAAEGKPIVPTTSTGVKGKKKAQKSPAPVSKTQNKIKNKEEGPQTPKSKKRKSQGQESAAKKIKVSENAEDFGGITAEPGKPVKMRSRLKLRRQVEIHQERLKERKKLRKTQKQVMLKKQNAKVREPTIKKKKKVNLDTNDKFNRLISQYKNKIQNSESFKKWYDT